MKEYLSAGVLWIKVAALCVLSSCSDGGDTGIADAGLIPLPQTVEKQAGSFLVTANTPVWAEQSDAAARAAANRFSELMSATSAFAFRPVQSEPPEHAIRFITDASVQGAEGYVLTVNSGGVDVRAAEPAGLFYGAVTVWQMLTPKGPDLTQVRLQSQTISDAPEYAWRGIMLDSARHFQSTHFIRKFIDWMAVHKLNVLHWHMIDDQAWRLEIRKYPKLTSLGAYRVQPGAGGTMDLDPATGKPRLYGGFYSQEDVREIVRYAAERHIRVVPEIEMPGHASALLAAYPQYGVTGEDFEIKADWGVYKNLYNVEEETFAFIEDVLTEAMALFPDEYIHIGADEAVKFQWQESPRVQERMRELGLDTEEELQSYFVQRVEKFLNANGRKLIGWDEILEGGLSPNATVMSWRGEVGGIEAAKQGHDVIMTPGPVLYFDFLQSDLPDEPSGRWVPRIQPLEKVYAYDPVPDELTLAESRHVLGVQANIWTEHMRTEDHVVHAAFPRMAALAETAWSAPEAKNFERFLDRLTDQMHRYEKLGVTYADSAFQVQFKTVNTDDGISVELSSQTGFGDIRYTLDGTDPTANSPRYDGPLTVALPLEVRANSFYEGLPLADASILALDATNHALRHDTDLKTCESGLVIKLEDDDPAQGPRTSFVVDIMNPCWVYKDANLSGVTGFEANIGQLPFNFRLGNYSKQVALPTPETETGELQVRLDSCEGELLASMPVPSSNPTLGIHKISGPIRAIDGVHDLCLRFAGNNMDPYWAIDRVNLLSAATDSFIRRK